MPPLSPIQIAVIVIAAVSLLGVIITSMRKGAMLAGYGDYRKDIEKITSTLKLEMFRDGDDVVLTGNHKQKPIQIRFSYSETTPGLNIRMQAPVSFTFSVVPKGAPSTEGRVLVRTGDDMFDARFAARTDHPTQAKMLVGSKQMRTQMEKLCCSSKTFLTLTTGNMELSELVIPQPYTARHVLDHLDSMAMLGDAVEDIPGAEKVKVTPYRREKSTPFFRIAVAIGAITAIIAVFALQNPSESEGAGNGSVPVPQGILPVDAMLIPRAEEWRAASADDFNTGTANWIKSFGVTPDGRFELDTDGSEVKDVVYFLVNDQGKRRVVLLQDRENVFDSIFEGMVALVPVPKDRIANVEWKTPPSEEPNGDGLLIVRADGEELSGTILFPKGGRLISGTPVNFQNISLR